MADEKKMPGRSKAAVLLITLGDEPSSKILKYLNEKEIEGITFEIARHPRVDPVERDKTISEFSEMLMAQEVIQAGGIDYARSMLEKSLGSQRAMQIIEKLTASIQVKPFDFIKKAEPGHIMNFIQGEHPQTIALILSYLDAKMSSAIIAQLPLETQADVAKRIATMDRTSPDVLREVERVLERKLSSLVNEEYAFAGGIQTVVDILNNVDRATEKGIMETLEEEDPELAEEIKKRLFVFEDVVLLDDRAIQQVLREVDTKELALALKSVEENVKTKIFANMSKRAASMLAEDMEYMGPVRLRDVEEAQQRVVGIIRRLEEEGEIVVARGGEEELVV